RHLSLVEGEIDAFIQRFEAMNRRSNTPGYVPRWIARSGPVGDSLPARQGDPSIDEYSGLLLGLTWARRMLAPALPDPLSQIGERTRALLADVKSYFDARDYWLIRPRPTPDLVFNGAVSAAAGFGIESALASGLGFTPGAGGKLFQPPPLAHLA